MDRSTLQVPLEEARTACAASVEAFVRAVDELDGARPLALLDASRCRGWSRLDVVVHVLDGWRELLGGLLSPAPGPPTVDAASYWTAFAQDAGDQDPVARVLALRRRTTAYAGPAEVRRHLAEVADALLHGAAGLDERPRAFQGHVLAAGDLLATWAVEGVVHQLDLLGDAPVPGTALRLARHTVEALAGGVLPPSVDDVDAVLVGTGRAPLPPSLAGWAGRLPALA